MITRIRLDANDFKTLVSGGEVKKEGVEIILADIGFTLMQDVLYDVQSAGELNSILNYDVVESHKEGDVTIIDKVDLKGISLGQN